MPPPATRRWLEVSIWGSAVLTVIVCGLGVALTLDQYGDVQATMLEAERRAAGLRAESLDRQLQELEGVALRELERTWERGELAPPPPEATWLHDPFVVEVDDARAEAGGGSPVDPALLTDAAAPRGWREAVSAARTAATQDAAQGLLRFGVDLDPPSAWRPVALAAAAAISRRAGAHQKAADLWGESVEASAGSALSPGPPREQIALARAESLALAGQSAAALATLESALPAVDELAAVRGTHGRAAFWLRRATALLEREGRASEAIRASSARLAAERERQQALEALRAGVRLRLRLDPALRPTARQHFLATSGERDLAAVWSLTERAEAAAAVAYRVDLGELEEWSRRRLAPVPGEAKPRVPTGAPSSGDADEVLLARLGGDLTFVRLVKSRDAWERIVGDARRPFALAAILLGALGALLVGALVVLRRGVRREMRLSAMKTEFVANVSHELKTPLALIRLCSETLQLGRLRDPKRSSEYLEIITRETDRLSHLISNVLSFSSIEAGKKRYELRAIDLAPSLLQTLDAYFLQFRERGFECRHDIPDALPPVLADDEAVSQAVINLLQNAVRYSPQEKVIEASARVRGDHVEISVRDRGVGISREDLPKIWNDYYRTREARALGTRGSGLGLSLVRHILRAHGGRVEVTSAPGRGSTFTLVLPIAGGPERKDEDADDSANPDHRG